MNNKQIIKKLVFFGDSEYSKIILNRLNETELDANFTSYNFKPDLIIGKNSKHLLNDKYSLGIVASYGKIIPKNIIKKFKYGILNIHPSLLPKYRGPSPLQETIINGDKIAGVTIIKMTEKIDAGPILIQREFIIDKKYTTKKLGEILFNLGANLLIDILEKLKQSVTELPIVKQDENKATYTNLIKKENAKINWKESPEIIERKIRAYIEWPIAFSYAKIKTKNQKSKIIRIQILEAEVQNNEIKIKKIRPEGRKDMSWSDFLRGYSFQGFLD
ncbi:MAG: formyltransferase family protein [Patescibacteria group bacterium]